MVEIQVYAAGLRSADKLMGLDSELAARPSVRYKVDALHDVVYLESEDPALSLDELRGIFRKLDLEALFIGESRTVPPSATQLLRP